MSIHDRCEKILKIIEETEDGSLLSPRELFYTQEYLNLNLNEKGEQKIEELYQSIINDTFVPFIKRWFRNIENISADPKGAGGGLWILWKNNCIEHYDVTYAYSDEGLKALRELERRCKILESRNVKPTKAAVIWNWSEE